MSVNLCRSMLTTYVTDLPQTETETQIPLYLNTSDLRSNPVYVVCLSLVSLEVCVRACWVGLCWVLHSPVVPAPKPAPEPTLELRRSYCTQTSPPM